MCGSPLNFDCAPRDVVFVRQRGCLFAADSFVFVFGSLFCCKSRVQ